MTPNEQAVLDAWEAGSLEGRDFGRRGLSQATGIPRGTCRHIKDRLIAQGLIPYRLKGDNRETRRASSPPGLQVTRETEALPEMIRAVLKTRKDYTVSVTELADRLDRGPAKVREALQELHDQGYNLVVRDDSVALTKGEEVCQEYVVPTTSGQVIRFGAVGDTHLCHVKERLDALHAQYQWYADEGIDTVYHVGNWIEGESRLNVRERKVEGVDAQCEYFCEHYPQIDGITTKFISGKCHESWSGEREGISMGRHLVNIAEAGGRHDLEYLGYVLADVKFANTAGAFYMRLMHPGGGSSYARSYPVQKHIEAMQGGNKPAVFLMGHFHKMEYLPCIRNVKAFQCGCFVECGAWGVGRAMEYDVGGWLIELVQDEETGACIGARAADRTYFDKGFYEQFEPKPWSGKAREVTGAE